MNRTSLIFLFCLLCQTVRGQNEQKEHLSDALAFINVWLEAQQAYDHLPGISIGIVKDQELVWSKGYGVSNIKKNIPATPATVYSICSITKLFTSIAVMQLYEQGKLRLDDSLSSILPDFNIKQKFKDSGPITIRSLLTHSSGLPREADFPYWTAPDFKFPTEKEVAEKVGEQETIYPASTYFQYSNLGMTLLGQIVEKISGTPYDKYVEENIFKPLQLGNTYSSMPSSLWGNKLATGYTALKRDGTRDLVPLFDTRAIKPAAGFSSSVEDLAKLAAWQFRLLNNGGKEILRASTLREMQRVQWVDPDWKVHWGLGFVIFQQNGKTLIGKWGTCPGYRSFLLMDNDEKLGLVVLMNAMESPWKYASHVRSILLKAEKEKRPKSIDIDLTQYTGLYNAQPYNGEKRILPWYGNLAVIDLPSSNPLEDMMLLQHVKGDVFRKIRRDDTLGEEIVFERDKAGKVSRMWLHSNYSVKVE
jgi:CubicO group peptidase (beta-lactamase class C family)